MLPGYLDYRFGDGIGFGLLSGDLLLAGAFCRVRQPLALGGFGGSLDGGRFLEPSVLLALGVFSRFGQPFALCIGRRHSDGFIGFALGVGGQPLSLNGFQAGFSNCICLDLLLGG